MGKYRKVVANSYFSRIFHWTRRGLIGGILFLIVYLLGSCNHPWRLQNQSFQSQVKATVHSAISKPRAVNENGTTGKPLLSSVYSDDREIMEKLPPLDVIPKLLHFMWKNDRLPAQSVLHLREWVRLHPGWRFFLWTDRDLHKIASTVLQNSPLLRMFQKFRQDIERVDFSRYLIMHLIGGVYADIDLCPVRPLDQLVRMHSCVVPREPEAFSASLHRPTTILASNFLLASRPAHPLWSTVINEIKERKGLTIQITGPIALTDTLTMYKEDIPLVTRDSAVFMAPSMYFDPPVSYAGDRLHLNMLKHSCSVLRRQKLHNAFTRRVCTVFKRERRIDWSLSESFPRHFNHSFTKHSMFDTYGKSFMKVSNFVNISAFRLPLESPTTLFDGLKVPDPWDFDKRLISRLEEETQFSPDEDASFLDSNDRNTRERPEQIVKHYFP